MSSNEPGATLKGLAAYSGLPAALATLFVAPPLGVGLLAASVVALAAGNHQENSAAAKAEDEHWERVRLDTERKHDVELAVQREMWATEEGKLYLARDVGAISDDEFDVRMDELIDRWPS